MVSFRLILPGNAIALGVAVAIAVPTSAQTLDAAARGNLAPAVQPCPMDGGRGQAAVSVRVGEGYAGSSRGTSGIVVWHQFAAPVAIPFVVSVRGGGEMQPCAGTGPVHISSFSAV